MLTILKRSGEMLKVKSATKRKMMLRKLKEDRLEREAMAVIFDHNYSCVIIIEKRSGDRIRVMNKRKKEAILARDRRELRLCADREKYRKIFKIRKFKTKEEREVGLRHFRGETKEKFTVFNNRIICKYQNNIHNISLELYDTRKDVSDHLKFLSDMLIELRRHEKLKLTQHIMKLTILNFHHFIDHPKFISTVGDKLEEFIKDSDDKHRDVYKSLHHKIINNTCNNKSRYWFCSNEAMDKRKICEECRDRMDIPTMPLDIVNIISDYSVYAC